LRLLELRSVAARFVARADRAVTVTFAPVFRRALAFGFARPGPFARRFGISGP
jgi:hypothetical protein